jgi:hypothetical protein
MSILNVTYLHHPRHPEPIQLLSYELTDLNDTYTMSGPIFKGMASIIFRPIHHHYVTDWLMLYSGFGNNIIDPFTIGSAISTNATGYATAYSQQLSRIALALAAGITIPSTSLVEYISKDDIRGAQISLVPLVTFLFFFVTFIVSVLLIGIFTKTEGPMLKDEESQDVHAVSLAQMRLTNTAPIIYEIFCTSPGSNLGKSGYSNSPKLFDGAGDENKVRVGVLVKETPDANGQLKNRFAISTRPMRELKSVGGTVVS